MSHARFDVTHAGSDMFCAHFDKNLQISTLFLNTWKCSLEHVNMAMHVLTTPVRALTCSAHILTKTCKFQHYFLTLGAVPWNMLTYPMYVLTTPVRALTCSAHILTKTCKFQHYYLTLGS